MSNLVVVLFLGSNSILVYTLEVFVVVMLFIWARACFPRYRYDRLIELGWQSLLPVSLGLLVLVFGLVSLDL